MHVQLAHVQLHAYPRSAARALLWLGHCRLTSASLRYMKYMYGRACARRDHDR